MDERKHNVLIKAQQEETKIAFHPEIVKFYPRFVGDGLFYQILFICASFHVIKITAGSR
jgi:hypothetical protein